MSSRPRLAGFLIATACATGNPLLAQTRRAMVPEDIVSVRLATEVQLSPDGRVVAFVVEEPPHAIRPGFSRRSGVWLVNADESATPRRVVVAPNDSTGSGWQPRWSPDGRLLALISDHEGTPQVYVVSDGAKDGAPIRRITSISTGVRRFAWSPDGTTIAFSAQDPVSAEVRARAERTTAVEVGRDLRYTRLWTVGTRTGDTLPVLVTRDSMSVEAF